MSELGSVEAWEHVRRESKPWGPLTSREPDVTVIIPTIPGREALLERAMMSIRGEDIAFAVCVSADRNGAGPAVARTSAVRNMVTKSPWLAFLDDDDEFKPGHLTKLVRHAEETRAEVVYPWFDINFMGEIHNELDPLLLNGSPAFGQEFDGSGLDVNNFIPVTALVNRHAFEEVGGFPLPMSPEWPHQDCEDWGLWLRLRDEGAVFSHLPERSWIWHWHSRNTSGRPDRAKELYGRGGE